MANFYTNNGVVFDDQSAASTLTGAWINVGRGHTVGFHTYSASGTRAGTITVQGSGKPTPSSTEAVTLAFQNYSTGTVVTSLTVSNGVAHSALLGLPFYEFPWVRLIYTAGSGTGNLSCWFWQKHFGNSQP